MYPIFPRRPRPCLLYTSTINVFGSFDENIRIIEGEMEVSVVSRDSMLKVSGENAENVMYAVKAIEALMSLSSLSLIHI